MPDCVLLRLIAVLIAGQVEATLRERNAADLELYAFARELVSERERGERERERERVSE